MFYEGRTTPINALVSDQLNEVLLLSLGDLRRMNIIPKNFPHILNKASVLEKSPQKVDKLEDLLEEFKDVFNEEQVTPMVGEPMHIHIRKDSAEYKPLKMKVARKTSMHFQQKANSLLQKLLE